MPPKVSFGGFLGRIWSEYRTSATGKLGWVRTNLKFRQDVASAEYPITSAAAKKKATAKQVDELEQAAGADEQPTVQPMPVVPVVPMPNMLHTTPNLKRAEFGHAKVFRGMHQLNEQTFTYERKHVVNPFHEHLSPVTMVAMDGREHLRDWLLESDMGNDGRSHSWLSLEEHPLTAEDIAERKQHDDDWESQTQKQEELGKRLKFSLGNFKSRFFNDPVAKSSSSQQQQHNTSSNDAAPAEGETKVDYELPKRRDTKINDLVADNFEPPADRKYVLVWEGELIAPTTPDADGDARQGWCALWSPLYENFAYYSGVNLNEFDTFAMKVRTDGRRYIFNVRPGGHWQWPFIWMGQIAAETPRPWHQLFIKFGALEPTILGKPTYYTIPLKKSAIGRFGFSVQGTGTFRFELEWIKTYRAKSHPDHRVLSRLPEPNESREEKHQREEEDDDERDGVVAVAEHKKIYAIESKPVPDDDSLYYLDKKGKRISKRPAVEIKYRNYDTSSSLDDENTANAGENEQGVRWQAHNIVDKDEIKSDPKLQRLFNVNQYIKEQARIKVAAKLAEIDAEIALHRGEKPRDDGDDGSTGIRWSPIDDVAATSTTATTTTPASATLPPAAEPSPTAVAPTEAAAPLETPAGYNNSTPNDDKTRHRSQ